MRIFSVFDMQRSSAIHSPKSDNLQPDLSDPDAMYDTYLAPTLNIFEPVTKQEWERDVATAHQIELDLRHTAHAVPSHDILTEMSIQISVYEALLFRDILKHTISNQWRLSKLTDHAFEFSTTGICINAHIDHHLIRMSKNNTPIGTLHLDMEWVLLEKIHGTLFGHPFVLDPIWLKQQKKCDATLVQIDHMKTEVVHKKHHKDTLWQGGSKRSIMTVSKNESVSLNNQLLLNTKRIHWEQTSLLSLQWFTPWVRLPIHGRYLMASHAST